MNWNALCRGSWLLALSIALSGCAQGFLPPRETARPAFAAPEPRALVARRDDVLRFARAQVGKPYCWGGAGPSCFDCSGLVETAWRHAGVALPRTSEAMSRQLPEVPLLEARAGDVLYWPGHVALYAGDGKIIDAGATRHQIAERRLWGVPRVLRPMGT